MEQSKIIRLFADPSDPATFHFIHDDDAVAVLQGLGVMDTVRASNVEPSLEHPGQWTADMTPFLGHLVVLGPYPTRREALAAEQALITETLQR